MVYIDFADVSYVLPNSRPLLTGVSFKVTNGQHLALIGANGAGKSTLIRLLEGAVSASSGQINHSGNIGYLRQFTSSGTVRDLLLNVSPQRIRQAAHRIEEAQRQLTSNTDKVNIEYADAITNWGDIGGYEYELLWNRCTKDILGKDYSEVANRQAQTLSGGEQKRLALAALFESEFDILVLDEPDNYLDVYGKQWFERTLNGSAKTVLYISHDRHLLEQTAHTIVSLELNESGNVAWTHHGKFSSFLEARKRRFDRFEEINRRWHEEHLKLINLVERYRIKAVYNDNMASRYKAAQTRLKRYESTTALQKLPRPQDITMKFPDIEPGSQSVVCSSLSIDGLTGPLSTTIRTGERIAVSGKNGVGKSHFLKLLGSTADLTEHEGLVPAGELYEPVRYSGTYSLGAGIRPGWFSQTHERPDLKGRSLVDILHRGTSIREGMPEDEALEALAKYELQFVAFDNFENLSGGQQARFQILLLELGGASLLLLDEPTDNLDLESAQALQAALRDYRGAVIAVTHDRWFAQEFERFIIFERDGEVRESYHPDWEMS
ncbi:MULTISPECIES: ABC-F family ATP-binding cassette domain-containing protein [Rothia]|uniref:ABC transporter n=1 Tax=Rothia nasimurium TaxID=85336 RepID=A0A1Y1RLS3_9MICC|nr:MULTISPECIES: ATP-binding cassette domain-containing protein [Rothia]ORC15381.1 ABC transporter [Rothia nasimurium]